MPKTAKNFVHDNLSPSPELIPGPTEKEGVIDTQQRSVLRNVTCLYNRLRVHTFQFSSSFNVSSCNNSHTELQVGVAESNLERV
jgi:hypothetical protein